MAAIRIDFPKLGHTVSTWVADEVWLPLSPQQRTALIGRFVKNHHASSLNAAIATTGRKSLPNFRFSEI
jgi:hypothetical protein